MGTNYYWRDRPCGHCGRFETIHVCLSGHTWRGYKHELFNAEHPDWGYDPESPFGFPVLSVADWRTVFTERHGLLFDEHGKQIDDPLTWLDEIKPPDDEHRARKLHWHGFGFEAGSDWWDPQGYHFYGGEFS